MASHRGQVAMKTIIRDIFLGALSAARAFDKATGGCRLSDASEHFLTAGIFRKLAALPGATHLEVPVAACRKDAGAVKRGKPSAKERLRGRFDMVHYRVDEHPRIVVEVKNCVRHLNKAQFRADFSRLTSTLYASSKSSYQCCVFVYFATADYKKSITQLIAKKRIARARLKVVADGVEKYATEFLQNRTKPLIRRHYTSRIRCSGDSEEGGWYIGMVVFAPKASTALFPRTLVDPV